MSKARSIYTKASPLLAPFGEIYGQLMKARRAVYRKGFIGSYRPACPTVAVGNISWGGTGKTPVTGWLLDWAAKNELKAVVLTRGYKGTPPTLPFIVNPAGNPAESGDEPLMLAKLFPSATVLVDPKRARAAQFAERELYPGLFIMDDGFQHLGLRRDLNILLLTPDDLGSGWNKVIPAGTWREGATALEAANVALVRWEGKIAEEDVAGFISTTHEKLRNIPVFLFRIKNTGLRRLGSSELVSDLGGAPYNLFCGVGSPHGVRVGATGLLKQAPRKFIPFGDHHIFSRKDFIALCESGLDLVCTEKDAIKLEFEFQDIVAKHAIWAMQAEIEFLPNAAEVPEHCFENWWKGAWQRIKGCGVSEEQAG